jgi:hypothetical protein
MECPKGADESDRMSAASGKDTRSGGLDMHGFQADAIGCVWTGFRSGGCACDSRIPTDVVTAAWRSQLEQDRVPMDRFFRFNWQDGLWLAYGLKDGRVRGVYCPSHSAQREERSLVADSSVGARTSEHALYA